jgi:hypothetical protein
MLTASRITIDAQQIAKVRGFTIQALDQINAILSDLCQTTDLALARGQFNFNFNPQLTSLFGSGPYPLPLDYLRTSGSSGARGVTKSAWYLYPTPAFPAGQPIFMTPIDLAEFDLFPQLPSQSTPELWCTDMGGPLTQRIILATTMATTLNSVTATPVSLTGLVAGLGVAGEGIKPGTTIIAAPGPTITLSLPATATLAAASVFFGIAPVAYVYPAPLGTYPVTVRYQRMMPPLIDLTQYPWFPMDSYMIYMLASKLMAFAGDDRIDRFEVRAMKELGRYLGLSDDKTNRAQQVQLDGRMFGHGSAGGQNLRNTKNMGW